MDREEPKRDWGWLPTAMPRVAALVADKRREFGSAHVAQCWKQGVELGEPGWFFAIEGPLSVGTPWDREVIDLWLGLQAAGKAAGMVFLRTPDGGDGEATRGTQR